ncbi:hypothetical protein [Sphingomonas bacterium]|uniref:hypothetical protein n=1 Tax=Sphingomonas bacterium TaxID=1895847 RepID=UPI0015773E33|nr:hypothetical protein [Sphingomonas bacterium]
MPLFSTPTQFLVLGLVLVAGWLFGLASHPGGRKWRDRYAAERDAHATNRRAADQKHSADRARIAELETENARVVRAAPAAQVPVAATPVARSSAVPAYAGGEKRGWFDWDRRPAP